MGKKGDPKWQETNVALIGSDLDKKVKEAAAQGEPAWSTAKVGSGPGLFVWRIEQFNVKPWPAKDQGTFYCGDSYIVLSSVKKQADSDALKHDAFFWIGKLSSQDEYGTAAYKTVELDDYLKGAAVQHREVDGSETAEFKALFKQFRVCKGGVDSGFNHVAAPEAYVPRILHLKGTKDAVSVREVKAKASNLNSNDAFIVDAGTRIIQWNGKTANKDEKAKAAEVLRLLASERAGRSTTEVIDQGAETDEFWGFVGGRGEIAASAASTDAAAAKDFAKALMKLSDAGGKLTFTKVDKVDREQLKTDSVFVLDDGVRVFAWVGAGASPAEKKNAMLYAGQYIRENNRPSGIPVTLLKEGQAHEAFDQAIGGAAAGPSAAKKDPAEQAKDIAQKGMDAIKKKKGKKCLVQ